MELNALPGDWRAAPLERISVFITKGSTPTTYGFKWQASGVLFLRSECVAEEGLDLSESMFISPEAHAALRRSEIRDGDILMTITGYVGRVILLSGVGEANMNQHVARVRIVSDEADARYVHHALSQPKFRKYYSSITTGQAYPQISLRQVRDTEIPLPKVAEQRAIAAALSDVDALIGALDKLIAKKRDLKQAAMQQLLTGQTRLPGFTGEWEAKRLGQIADVKTGPFGSSLHESDYVQEGTPIITVEHLGEFGVDHTNLPLVSDADRARLNAYSLEIGDIVFSRVGSVDRNALIRQAEAGWLFSGRLLRVRPDNMRAHPPFLSYQFHSEPFKASVRSVAVGQTMASLNTRILQGLTVTLPSIEEQAAIAGVLSDMDAELTALEARRDKTRAIKHGMMQELLTGRIRLVRADN